jgi:hypothetical protein
MKLFQECLGKLDQCFWFKFELVGDGIDDFLGILVEK